MVKIKTRENRKNLSEKYQCPICGSKNNKMILKNGFDYEYGIKGTFNFFECMGCQLISLIPRPFLVEIKRFYPSHYHAYKRPTSLWFKLLSNINLMKRKNRYEYLIGNTGNILDVGCGDGEIIETLKQNKGHDCYGIEFKEDIAELGKKKGLKVTYGTLETTKEFQKQFFSLIIMNHLIEHVENPDLLLKKALRLLKHGGWISGETPNTNCLERIIFKGKWAGFHVPRHLQIFSKKNLTQLLKNVGFTKVSIKKSFTPGQWALSLQNVFLDKFPNTKLKNGKSWIYSFLLVLSIPIVMFENLFLSETGVMYFEAKK